MYSIVETGSLSPRWQLIHIWKIQEQYVDRHLVTFKTFLSLFFSKWKYETLPGSSFSNLFKPNILWDCGTGRTSHLLTSPWALGNCDGHFSQFSDLYIYSPILDPVVLTVIIQRVHFQCVIHRFPLVPLVMDVLGKRIFLSQMTFCDLLFQLWLQPQNHCVSGGSVITDGPWN